MRREDIRDGTEVTDIYVRTVKVGPFVYVAGTTSLDSQGRVVGDDAGAQTTATMAKIVAALDSAGAAMDDVVRLTIFCTDIADADAIAAAIQPFHGRARPTATLVAVSALAVAGLLVEIQADAVLTGA
jgi:2-iminobutanoate/2-iminopropanoate deaminase